MCIYIAAIQLYGFGIIFFVFIFGYIHLELTVQPKSGSHTPSHFPVTTKLAIKSKKIKKYAEI